MSAPWSVLLAYLLGSVPTGFLLVKWTKGADIRNLGSGNIGATNVLRVSGLRAGLAVLLIDAGKAYLAVWLAGVISGQSTAWMSGAAVAVMAGNAYPVFLGFRGGKAVATFLGAFGCLSPAPTAAALAVFLVTAAITRYVSAGSIVAAAAFPLAVWLIQRPAPEVVAASIAAAALILWRHRDNIRRLWAGAEHVFSLRGQRK